MQHFHTTLLRQKPIFWQIEWGVQNGPITKNGVLICFNLRTSYKELIWWTNRPNSVIILLENVGVFFESVSSLWVSLNDYFVQTLPMTNTIENIDNEFFLTAIIAIWENNKRPYTKAMNDYSKKYLPLT